MLFCIFNALSERNLLPGACERRISVWRSQTFGFPIYLTPDIISLIRGKVWLTMKVDNNHVKWG